METTKTTNDALALHRPYLMRYAASRLKQRDAAEDVVQETLLAAIHGGATFREDSTLRTWLTGILKHKIFDRCRHEARDPVSAGLAAAARVDGDADESIDGLFDADGHWITPPSPWPDPQQCLENRQFWEILNRGLDALPKATAHAYYLREIEGWGTEQICAELGITAANCWVMLYRARMSLREELEGCGFARPRSRAAADKGNSNRATTAHANCAMISPRAA